ncbi:MAG TPA: FAD-binding oxidoreductase [Marinagarivorans sp.]
MAVIKYDNQHFSLAGGQSVLDGLLANGHNVPNACRAGACQSCKLQATDGEIPIEAQQGLNSAEKQLGYFLSCQCYPTTDLNIATSALTQSHSVKVLEKTQLSDDVVQLKLEAPIHFEAGQFINLSVEVDGNARSYSIASLPSDGFIECHIKRIPGGVFSDFAFKTLQAGDTLRLQGPFGKCIYSCEDKSQPMVLAGLGTGLAPLLGITRSALAKGHNGPMHLIVGAKSTSGLYMTDKLRALAEQYSNLQVTQIAQQGAVAPAISADIYQFCKQTYPSTQGFSLYLCGAQSFVTKLKKQSFLLGASMAQIHADSFVACS